VKPKKPNKPKPTPVYRNRAAPPNRESDKGRRNATPSSFCNAPPAGWRRVASGLPALAAWHALAAEQAEGTGANHGDASGIYWPITVAETISPEICPANRN